MRVEMLKSTMRGRRTAGSKGKRKYRGEKRRRNVLCVFGIHFFENPISRFMSAYCNRFVINESFTFPISYRLIFNKFVAVRLKLLVRGAALHASCSILFNTNCHCVLSLSFFIANEKTVFS